MSSFLQVFMKAWSVTFNKPVPYADGLAYQHRLLKARQQDEIPDTVMLLQHQPVVTLGNRRRDNHLLKTEEEYRALGIDLFQVERGGDVTFHGPGQWVLYPILRLGGGQPGSQGHLFNLEETALRALADYGVAGFRREGKPGAWTAAGKIAAIGFRLKRWVSFHGMSFNVMNTLDGFDTIMPCGLEGESITTLQRMLGGECPAMQRVEASLLHHFSEVCARELVPFKEGEKLPGELDALLRNP